MPEAHEYVDGFRSEVSRQAQPENLPKLVVPALITAFAIAYAGRYT